MKYKRFEDLPVWNAALDLYVRIDSIKSHEGFRRQGDMLNQLQRAGLSISNNIAEGFELGTTEQLITFLYTAKGSAGEVRSVIRTMEALPGFVDIRLQTSSMIAEAEGISRQLRAWLDSLQNSDIKGQRYLTQEARDKVDQERRSEAFLARLREITPKWDGSGAVLRD